ncbi:MAG: hypothetical protein RR060_06670 [Victivallaceae bacterium]
MAEPDTGLRLFGKPEVRGHRRVGVVLARDKSVPAALAKAERSAAKLQIIL